jgi:hypothetical protein
MSVQVSTNEKHLLLIFDGQLLNSHNSDKKPKLFFIESFNGGENWSKPKLVVGSMNDELEYHHRSLLMDKDTDRAYAIHKRNNSASLFLSIKEPGMKEFEPGFELPGTEDASWSDIKLTAEKPCSRGCISKVGEVNLHSFK